LIKPARIPLGENADINIRNRPTNLIFATQNQCEDSDGEDHLNFSPACAFYLYVHYAAVWTAVSSGHPEYPGKQHLQCLNQFNFSRTRANTLIQQNALFYVG
jgi:hypothetical protein